MSILNKHATDYHISKLAQHYLNGVYPKNGGKFFPHIHPRKLSKTTPKVEAKTFFLNPELLGCTPDTMEHGVMRQRTKLLPIELSLTLPVEMDQNFLNLAFLAYPGVDKYFIVMSRPDNRSSLAERVGHAAKIKGTDIAIDENELVCGFDNLDLIYRVSELFMTTASGGADHLQGLGLYNCLLYKCMRGAENRFKKFGGDDRTVALYEAASHIGAFTQSKIPWNCLGYMGDYRLPDFVIELAYCTLYERLAQLEYTVGEPIEDRVVFSPIEGGQLLQGMTTLFDECENNITLEDGRRFRAFHRVVTSGEGTTDQNEIVGKMKFAEFRQCSEHFIVFQTLKGLRMIMGENTQKYVPERGPNSFDRVCKLLDLSPS